MKTIIIVSGVVAAIESVLIFAALAIGMGMVQRPAVFTSLGKVRSYQVSCATTAGGTDLSDGSPISSIFVFINSATPVYIGGTDVDSTHGMPVCTAAASCAASSLSLDVKEARCLSSSGTVTATVIAGSL